MGEEGTGGEDPSISTPSEEEWIGWTANPSHRRCSWERRRVPRSNSVRSCSWHLAKITHRPCQSRPLPGQRSPCLGVSSSLSLSSPAQPRPAVGRERERGRKRESRQRREQQRQEDARECQEIYFKLRVRCWLDRRPHPLKAKTQARTWLFSIHRIQSVRFTPSPSPSSPSYLSAIPGDPTLNATALVWAGTPAQ